MTNPAVKADAIKQIDMLCAVAGLTSYTDLHKLGGGLLSFMETVHRGMPWIPAAGETPESITNRAKAIEAARRILKDATA